MNKLIEIREHCFPSNSLNIQFISILFIDLEKILIYNHNPPLKLYSIFHTRNCNTLGIKDTIWWTYTPGNDALQDSHHSTIQISNQFGEDEGKKRLTDGIGIKPNVVYFTYPFTTLKHKLIRLSGGLHTFCFIPFVQMPVSQKPYNTWLRHVHLHVLYAVMSQHVHWMEQMQH